MHGDEINFVGLNKKSHIRLGIRDGGHDTLAWVS